MKSIKIDISYSQIAIFNSSIARPFNVWSKGHVDQGFSWRSGSVSFRTLEEAGIHVVEIVTSYNTTEASPDAIRVIQVPFEVFKEGKIEISSITDSDVIKLPSGIYNLRFENFATKNAMEPRINLIFTPTNTPAFAILRADSALTRVNNLIVSADPA